MFAMKQQEQDSDTELNRDADQPLKPVADVDSVDVFEVPLRRKGFAIVRGRRLFDDDTPPQSTRSKSHSTSPKASSATSKTAGEASGKRNIPCLE